MVVNLVRSRCRDARGFNGGEPLIGRACDRLIPKPLRGQGKGVGHGAERAIERISFPSQPFLA